MALLLAGYPGGDRLKVAQELSQLPGEEQLGFPGSCHWDSPCVPRQVSECEWGAWQGGWVRTATDGLLQKEEIKFQTAADLCRNSDQGLSHLGDQISFTSWFLFQKTWLLGKRDMLFVLPFLTGL